jgi:hypothetical protein
VSKVDLGTGIGIMALSVAVFFIAGKMPDAKIGIGPGEYPMVVAGVLFILGLVLSLQNIPWKAKAGYAAKDSGGKPISLQMVIRPFLIAIVVFAYIRGMFYLGFLLLTPFFLFFAIWFFGYKRYLKAAAISLITTAVIYVVFYYGFQVLLPRFILF